MGFGVQAEKIRALEKCLFYAVSQNYGVDLLPGFATRLPAMGKSKGLNGVRGLYEKRGWFYYQPPTPTGGKRPAARALRTRDLVEAVAMVEEERMNADMERAVISGTLKEILPKYYEAKKSDEVKTRRAREVILNQFMEMTGNPKAADLTAEVVEKWRDDLLLRKVGKSERSLSGATVKSYTITLRAFVNWLLEERVLRVDPMAKLKRQTRVVATRRQEFLTQAQRDVLLADEFSPLPLRMILHFGFLAGLRYAEMMAMTPRWIWISPDGSQGSVTVQETPVMMDDGNSWVWKPKTKEMRTVPLHPRLLEFLKDKGYGEPFVVAPEKSLWPGGGKQSLRMDMKKSLASLSKRAGVPKLNFHMMRHSFATHLAMNGVPLARIAALLGDSLAVTEKHYAGFCPNHGDVLNVL